MLAHRQLRKTHCQGAALVEFALVVPAFFLLLFAIVEFGRGFMVSSLLTNAARSGCRVGMLSN
jgi:Flp pilus assembly protein TadG